MLKSWLYNRRRRELLKRCQNEVMRRYLAARPPSPDSDFEEAEYLAADLEMTGLDPRHDHILSIGFVPIIQRRIRLRDARHMLVTSRLGVGQSATIHGIHDNELRHALPLTRVMQDFMKALGGRVLILHCAAVDLAFIGPACEQRFDLPLLAPLVDTLQLEKKRLMAAGRLDHLPGDGLRLAECRARYHLPRYPAHNALTDALATAELFLAQAAHSAGGGRLPLRYFLDRG